MAYWSTFESTVPHLRDGFIVAKVGHFRGSENPDTPNAAYILDL
jgi:hypothetical protein